MEEVIEILCFLAVPLASVFIWTSVGKSANSNHGVELKTVKILPDATLDYVLVKKLRGRVKILATSSSSNAKRFNVDESMTISQFAKKNQKQLQPFQEGICPAFRRLVVLG